MWLWVDRMPLYTIVNGTATSPDALHIGATAVDRVYQGANQVWPEAVAETWESVCRELGATFIQVGTTDTETGDTLTGTTEALVATAGIDGMAGATRNMSHFVGLGSYAVLSMVACVRLTTTSTNGKTAGVVEADMDGNTRATMATTYNTSGNQFRLLYWGTGSAYLGPPVSNPPYDDTWVMGAATFTQGTGGVAWVRDQTTNTWLTNTHARSRTYLADDAYTTNFDVGRGGEFAGLALFPEVTLTEQDLERLRLTVPTIT